MALRVFEIQLPLQPPWVVLGSATGSGCTDIGGSFWRCDWLSDVFSRRDESEDKVGLPSPSIAEISFGESEADREIVLLPLEFGRDESRESDDELA